MKTIGLDITVLNDSRRTGIANYTYYLIKNLLELNKNDKFILFGYSTFETYQYLNNIDLKKYPNVSIKVQTIPSKLFRSVFLLWQKINFPNIETFVGQPLDIFHSFNFYLPPQKKGKTVATVFDLTSLINPKWHQGKTSQLDKVRFARVAKYADLITTISENSKADYQKIFHKKNIEVIYPGVDTLINDDKDLSKEVLDKFNLEKDYLLSVSTIEPRKNIKSLINAYLKSKVSKKLVLVGKSGWKSADTFKLINKYKDKIVFTDFVSDSELEVLYKNAYATIYPSFYEGFGLPVLESFKYQVPVICSDTSSLPEVGGKAALYINPDDPKEIEVAINRLIKDKKLYQKLKKESKVQVNKFNWIKSATKLNNLYTKLLSP